MYYDGRMRILNRTAVSVVGAQPYVDWTRSQGSRAEAGIVTVGLSRPFGSTFLLPEMEFEEDAQEWIEENASWIFEFQLSAWTEDESAWPAVRDLKTFREWFAVDLHSVVVDMGDDEIEGEQL